MCDRAFDSWEPFREDVNGNAAEFVDHVVRDTAAAVDALDVSGLVFPLDGPDAVKIDMANGKYRKACLRVFLR